MYSTSALPSFYTKVGESPTHHNQNKKFWFIVSLIFALGLLIAAAIGGVGLFANQSSLPQWLAKVVGTVGEPGNWTFWTMLIAGGVLGIGASVFGFYGLCKKSVTEKMLDLLPKNSYTHYTDYPDEVSFFESKPDESNKLDSNNNRYYLYIKNRDGKLCKKENLTFQEFNTEVESIQSCQSEVKWNTLWKDLNRS